MQSCISRINYLWRNLEVNFHLFHHLPKAINTHKQTLSCWSISWKNVHVTALVVFIYSLYTMYNVHIHCTIMYSFLGSVHINWRCFKSLTNQNRLLIPFCSTHRNMNMFEESKSTNPFPLRNIQCTGTCAHSSWYTKWWLIIRIYMYEKHISCEFVG